MLKFGIYFFYWHDISNDNIIPNGIRTSPDRFKCEINFIKKNFKIVSITEAINCIKENLIIRFEKPLAVICFDDGFKSLLTNVKPLLIKNNIPFTMFLNSAFLDQAYLSESILCEYVSKFMSKKEIKVNFDYVHNRHSLWSFLKKTSSKDQLDKLQQCVNKSWINKRHYLSWNDLNMLNNKLITICNHTSHHLWMPNLNKADQEDQINASHLKLKKISNYVKLLAIPFGSDDSYDKNTLSLIKKYSDHILIKANGSINHQMNKNLLIIERIGMSNNKPKIQEHIHNRLREKNMIFKMKKILVKVLIKSKLYKQ